MTDHYLKKKKKLFIDEITLFYHYRVNDICNQEEKSPFGSYNFKYRANSRKFSLTCIFNLLCVVWFKIGYNFLFFNKYQNIFQR